MTPYAIIHIWLSLRQFWLLSHDEGTFPPVLDRYWNQHHLCLRLPGADLNNNWWCQNYFITSNAQPNGSKSWWCWWRCRWIQTETLVMNSSMAMLFIRVDNGLPWCQTASRNQGRLRFTLEKGRSLLFLGLRWSPWSSGGCSGLTGEGSQR